MLTVVYIINQIPHIGFEHLILKEDKMIPSRIGCVHYEYYNDENQLLSHLEVKRSEIQCLVSVDPFNGWDHVMPGQSQYPQLNQYADGIDTMRFLTTL